MDAIEIYEAKDGWRWRRITPNGKIISESGEAYTRKLDAQDAALRANSDDYDLAEP